MFKFLSCIVIAVECVCVWFLSLNSDYREVVYMSCQHNTLARVFGIRFAEHFS